MSRIIEITTAPQTPQTEYGKIAARLLGIPYDKIASFRIRRKSIDARKKDIKINLSLEIFFENDAPPQELPPIEYRDVRGKIPVIIVGCGPAGLGAALRALELGLKPVIVERGKDISERKKDIASINRNEKIDPDSNYAFGEGGAGTFSDGKLFTRSKKRGNHAKALQVLHNHGASEKILYESHPHIGSDKLPEVIKNIRRTILNHGGEVHFNSRVTDIITKGGKAVGVTLHTGENLEGAAVILATGHSARDVYEMLHKKGIELEEKNFAVGLRVEHPQQLIDRIQYKRNNGDGLLPSASYQLVTQAAGRGVYSFCMCPGGFIVPAATADGECVVNGMSPSRRNSPYANSGIVTEVRSGDIARLREEHGPLAGLRFQQMLEQSAHLAGGERQIAPAQRLADFIKGIKSLSIPKNSYLPGNASSQMGEWLPPFIYEALRLGFGDFGRKMRGFVTNEALLLGVESRTSSPLRIPRNNDTLQHTTVGNLYPCGEGAGYAGGIISAMVDGERCTEAFVLSQK